MAYTVKTTNPATVTTDSGTDKMTVNIGFYVWVDTYDATTTGAQITHVIDDYSTKTTAQQEAEIDAAVAAYITANYPE
jgi:hypothetical protein